VILNIDAVKYVFDASDIAEFCAFTKNFKTDKKAFDVYALRLFDVIRADAEFFKNIDFFASVGNYQNLKINYSQKLAEFISAKSGKPLSVIEKIAPSKEVKFLPHAARASEIKNTFKVNGNFKGAKICIIDDVIASGATMSEAAGVFKAAGAVFVSGAAVCLNALR
jgi:predicted amidophosphoribosyltransferase